MVFQGAYFGEGRPGRMEEMAVPLDMRNGVRELDARGAREPRLQEGFA